MYGANDGEWKQRTRLVIDRNRRIEIFSDLPGNLLYTLDVDCKYER